MKSSSPTLAPELQAVIDTQRAVRKQTGQRSGILPLFRGAQWAGGDFSETNWTDEDFSGCDLRGADFHGCVFSRADFTEAKLYDANLRDAKLADAQNLLPEQLAGSDLTRAKLPDDVSAFPMLGQVKELSQSAAKLFLVLLGFGAFVLLSIATARDRELLLNQRGTKLPIIDVEIPLLSFYFVAPVLLLLFYIYFHLYLQRLWSAMAELPAVFPDGRHIGTATYPWLVNDLCLDHVPLKNRTDSWPERGERLVIRVLVWWTGPFLLWLIWAQAIRAQSWALSRVHLVSFCSGLVVALWFDRYIREIFLRFRARHSTSQNSSRLKRICWLFLPPLFATLFLFAWTHSIFSTEEMDPRSELDNDTAAFAAPLPNSSAMPIKQGFLPSGWPRWGPSLLQRLAIEPFAQAPFEPFSIAPATWTGGDRSDSDEVLLVRGVRFHEKRLRHADMHGTFFVNSTFAHVRMENSTFRNADLRNTYFDRVWAQGVDFANARFSTDISTSSSQSHQTGTGSARAFFDKSWFESATFDQSKMDGVFFRGVNLSKTHFRSVEMQRSRFEMCHFPSATFEGATLSFSYFEAGDFRTDFSRCNFASAKLDQVHFGKCTMAYADFTKANLNGADLSEAVGLTLGQFDQCDTAGMILPTEWKDSHPDWMKEMRRRGGNNAD